MLVQKAGKMEHSKNESEKEETYLLGILTKDKQWDKEKDVT